MNSPELNSNSPTPVEPKTVPAAHGLRWVLHGFALLRAYPGFWLLLLFFYWVGLMAVGSLPVIGVIALLLTVPGLAAGFMVACNSVQHKSPPLPAHLFLPFRRNGRAQLILGILYLGCMLVLMTLSSLIGGEVLLSLPLPVVADVGNTVGTAAGKATGAVAAKAQAMELRSGGLVAMLLYAPVMLAFWFAPALCYWHKLKPGKALFFSFFAGLRNSGAFMVYGMGWLLCVVVPPMLIGALLGLLMPGVAHMPQVAAMLLFPYLLIVVCAMMLSFYSTYVAVFGVPPPGNEFKPGSKTN